jgi:hypothetical protein
MSHGKSSFKYDKTLLKNGEKGVAALDWLGALHQKLKKEAVRHAATNDSRKQMSVFESAIASRSDLPRLPKDILNLLFAVNLLFFPFSFFLLSYPSCFVPQYVSEPGKVYVFGGLEKLKKNADGDYCHYSLSPSSECAVYDIASGKRSTCADLPTEWAGGCCVEYEGELLLIGGYLGAGTFDVHPSALYMENSLNRSVFIYSMAEDSWRKEKIKLGKAGERECDGVAFRDHLFLCGADGADTCIDCYTMEEIDMPQRGPEYTRGYPKKIPKGAVKSMFMKTAMFGNGLFVAFGCNDYCMGNYESARNWGGYYSERTQLKYSCCSLHIIDLNTVLDDPANARWTELPLPPIVWGHIRPDVSFYVEGTSLYLVGGTSAFDTECCISCSHHEMTDNHLKMDLSQDVLRWQVEYWTEDNDSGSAYMKVIPTPNGDHLLMGGFNKQWTLEGDMTIGDRLIDENFKRVKFASICVQPKK